jgi:peptidoglycan/LPS O-acetylase OafA/YrhL
MQHFRSVHYLRGIAALSIVIFHMCVAVPALDPVLKNGLWLESGVNIFNF